MDIVAPGTDAPVLPEDDPWATLAAPDAPPMPVPGDVLKPTMPWSDAGPGSGAEPAIEETVDAEPAIEETVDAEPGIEERVGAEQAIEEQVDAERAVTTTEEARTPGPVPTAVAASVPTVSFPPGVADKLAVYVYLLVDARTGRPFFVGRGRGDRCYRHVEAARTGDPGGRRADKYPLLERIREAESDGRPVRVEILRHGLSGAEADLVVAAVDDALTLGSPAVLGRQRTSAVELGASLARRAKIKRSHRVVLLRVGPYGSATDYGTARHGWRIGRRWIDTSSVRSPVWAVVVAGDLVDSVYRIDGWDLSPSSGGAVERYSFTGTPDEDLDRRYAGRSVSAYLGTGTPTQVTYVWCGPHWVNSAQ